MADSPSTEIHPALLLKVEYGLKQMLDPANQRYLTFDQIRECFNSIVMDAFHRRVLTSVMVECIQTTGSVHTCLMALEAANVYGSRLRKLEQETPNIDAAVKKLAADLERYRVWAVEHLDRMMECRSAGESLS